MTKSDAEHYRPLPTRIANKWFASHTYGADRVPAAADLLARKRAEGVRVSVGIPALNEEATVGDICSVISFALMDKVPLVDELVVLDGSSVDETALRARAAGARVVDVANLVPEVPVVGGKGDSLWRSLDMLSGDIVVWVDADIRNFTPGFVTRLVAPLLMNPDVDFVKGYYKRPIELGGVLAQTGGGRVTELLARPLLDLMFPELGGFLQPLAGEYAGRAEILARVPFMSGYSVEVALLIDLLDIIGLDGMAQVDLGTRVHRNRPLEQLGPMAFGIAKTILSRAQRRGRVETLIDLSELPFLVRNDHQLLLEPAYVEEVELPPLADVIARELVESAR